ncbi:hypothetical protein [Actinokineospora bangkokensis]|uniref:Uncharacterized protein n=1 Tax=Actinokineospora bangkokensis TaxID=1193682 RepID=A0A1Q9LD35_9PSEU|nr:hypothetical protein [Actinokineospora bangkokensis]OLR89915.1 hypothetical protein BJP25_02640 [Actinokineospora bangkokensis]
MPNDNPLNTALQDFLTQEGCLPPGRILTHAVVLYRTYAVENGKTTIRRGRCYPLGELDATLERGMLADALHDARHHSTA